MKYGLNDLLDEVELQEASALYLIEGFTPIIECPDPRKLNLDYDRLPTATLSTFVVPVLTPEDFNVLLTEIAEEIKKTMHIEPVLDIVSRSGFDALRFRRGTFDYDVFLFLKGERNIIQFRRPNRQHEQSRA